jgi:hypothetical protein
MKQKQDCFCYSAGVILFAFSLAVLFSAFKGTIHVLDRPDPFLILSHRQVCYLMGGLTGALSAFLLAGRDRWLKLVLLAWWSITFLSYWIGLWWSNEGNLFCYLGNMNDLPLFPAVINVLMLTILGGSSLGCAFFIVADWLKARNTKPAVAVETAATFAEPSANTRSK